MKSKAAIAGHPIHPALVVIPIGAWFAALVGDVTYQATANLFWYQFSYYTMGIGLLGALAAAVAGFIDYFGVQMSQEAYQKAKIHMVLNLVISALYAVNLWVRHDNGAVSGSRWLMAFALEVICYAALGVSGWLGGELSFRHKVGVLENADLEATRLGADEPTQPVRKPSYTRSRGMQG